MSEVYQSIRALADKFGIEGNPLYNQNVANFLKTLGTTPREGIGVMLENILESRLEDDEYGQYFDYPSISNVMELSKQPGVSLDLINGIYYDSNTGQPILVKQGL
jgi:hypothetical protein